MTYTRIDHELQQIVQRAGREAGERFDAAQYRRHPEWRVVDTVNRSTQLTALAALAQQAMTDYAQRMAIAVHTLTIALFGTPEQQVRAARIQRGEQP